MRSSVDQWAMSLATETAKRATCLRRAVGCVLLDEYNRVLSTGYNGVARGQPHCNESQLTYIDNVGILVGDTRQINPLVYPHACPGAVAPSGQGLDGCLAIHAEQNALLQCDDVMKIGTCYCTASPCITCMKLLLNTSCRRIIYLEEYPHPQAFELWRSQGRTIEKIISL